MNEVAVSEWVKHDKAYLVPIGDVHIGDEAFTKKSESLLVGYINWVKERDNARVILMGDIFNMASRDSKTNPTTSLSLKDEMRKAIYYFYPIKDKILGAIDGNHELRMENWVGYSPTIPFCDRLGIRYLGGSALFKIRVGKRNCLGKGVPKSTYIIYAHHTTGGGSTIGGKINRVDKLRQIIYNADVYLGAHNHALACAPMGGYTVSRRTGKVEEMRQMIVDCGSYLDWSGSYGEKKQYPPMKMGSPKIKLYGKQKKRDVHVSL